MKKTWALVLVLALLASLVTASAVAEEDKIRLVIRNIGSATSDENMIMEQIKKATGLDNLTIELKPGENYAQQCQILIASGDYPDAMEFQSATFPNDVQALADDGVIMPLDDLLAEYGQDIFQYRPESTWFRSTTDGKIYGIPTRIEEFGNSDINLIRKDWLDKLGLAVPETVEEFFQVLTAMKENSAQLVGEGQNFIPYGTFNEGYAFDALFSMFGSAHDVVRDWNVVDGDLTHYINMPGYKQTLTDIRRFYQAGLIEAEYPLMNREQFFEKFFNGVYGSYIWFLDNSDIKMSAWTQQYFGNFPEAEWAPIYPFKNEQGQRSVDSSLQTRQIVIFKDSKHAADIVKLCNYLISDEGVDLVQMGVKGTHWTEDESGIHFAELSNEDRVKMGYKSYYLICMQGFLTPVRAYEPWILELGRNMLAIAKDPISLQVTKTALENGAILTDIQKKYEAELIVKPDIDFDATFDRFVSEWNNAGGQAWTEEINVEYDKAHAQ